LTCHTQNGWMYRRKRKQLFNSREGAKSDHLKKLCGDAIRHKKFDVYFRPIAYG